MPLIDSADSRETLAHFFPGLLIEANVRPSGQRLVYYCSFPGETDVEAQVHWSDWGSVVLKVSEGVHPSVIARMEKERELLNQLSSPYFPRLLYSDVFSLDPVTDERLRHRLFITIEERIGGTILNDCMNRFRTEAACIRLMMGLTEGLKLLWDHPQKIVHRDLKPENVMIRSDGSPVILDLGIVREEGSNGMTATYLPMGPCTPLYASPEQLKNAKQFITFKSDAFALGVIAYELLAGTHPFSEGPGEPLDHLIHRVLTHEPPSLVSLGCASPRFSALVQRLLTKEPYMRPRTPADLSTEFIAALGAL